MKPDNKELFTKINYLNDEIKSRIKWNTKAREDTDRIIKEWESNDDIVHFFKELELRRIRKLSKVDNRK